MYLITVTTQIKCKTKEQRNKVDAPLFETVLEKSCKYVMCFNKQEVRIGCTCFLSNEEALDNWKVHMQNHGCLPISGQFQTTIKNFQPFFNRLAKLAGPPLNQTLRRLRLKMPILVWKHHTDWETPTSVLQMILCSSTANQC